MADMGIDEVVAFDGLCFVDKSIVVLLDVLKSPRRRLGQV